MGVRERMGRRRARRALAPMMVGALAGALATPAAAAASEVPSPLELRTTTQTTSARGYAEGLVECARLNGAATSRFSVEGATLRPQDLAELDQAVSTIEQGGSEVGFFMIDLASGASVSYHADSAFYSASSIKGPYVVSVVESELGDAAQADGRIDAILHYSDNDAYASFRSSYGDGPMHALVDASGAEQMDNVGITDVVEEAAAPERAGGIADNFYEFVTPRQLAALWQQCDAFLSSDEPGAQWLAGMFEEPEVSSLRRAGAAWGTTTWSKAGWYPDDEAAFATTVDAGVVRASTGDVVVVVMTTAPEDFSATGNVIAPLLALHSLMTH